MARTSELLVHLPEAARRLGVASTWLDSEARAGRLPALKAGALLLFNPAALERALADRLNREWAERQREVAS